MSNLLQTKINGKYILAIDFDGVIHSYESGWLGPSIIPDPPIPGALKFIEEATKHFTVMIFSARCNDEMVIFNMRTWFARYGLEPEVIGQLIFQPGKPSYRILIDDRAFRFSGDWNSYAIGHLLGTRTWQGK